MLSKSLHKARGLLIKIAEKIDLPVEVQAIRTKPWFKHNGDKTLRLNYDLKETSVVFDLGGYEGQWSSDIFSKYCCNIYLFEPHKEYANKIKERFEKNSKIKVFEFGLSNKDETLELNISADGSSLFKTTTEKVKIELKDAVAFFNKLKLDFIDLIKINIEGGEYDFLEAIVNSTHIKSIKNIQVQFHDFVPDAKVRMNAIQEKLSLTHSLTYQYEFVWENWLLKEDQ